MKKLLFVLAAVVFCMAATQANAQKWEPFVKLPKKQKAPGVIPQLQGMSELGWWGNFETAELYNKQGHIIQTLADSNLLRFENGMMASAGYVRFSDTRSAVVDRKILYGNDYISSDYADSLGLANRLQRLDEEGKFKPVVGIKFDGMFWMHDLGDKKVLFFGNFYEGKDKNGKKVFGGVCIWDMEHNTLEDVSNYNGFPTLRNYSVGDDNTLFTCTGAIRVMLSGTTVWANYQEVYQGGSFHQVLGIDKDNAYATWRRSDDAKYFLMKLNTEKKWEPIAEFSKPDVITTSVSLDFKTTGLARYKEYVIVSHTGTHLNGESTGLISAYNTITKEWKSLPVPSGINADKMGYVRSVGDSLYFITTHELIIGRQIVYLLAHDGALPVKLSYFDGKVQGGSHKIMWTTQSEKNASHFEVEASNDGVTFSKVARVSALGRAGSYSTLVPIKWDQTFYRLHMVDKDGSSEYSKVIKIGELTQHLLTIYPNPVANSLQVRGLLQNTTISIIGADGRVYRNQVLVPNQNVDVSHLPKGIYFLKVGDKTLKFVK